MVCHGPRERRKEEKVGEERDRQREIFLITLPDKLGLERLHLAH